MKTYSSLLSRDFAQVRMIPNMIASLMAHGPYRVAVPLFRFHRFTRWLIRTIETIYGTICVIPTHKLPQSVIY
ncbi:MAG: hypothetical protein QY302_13935 [Anaerolineales bacterium]|nr:MAG: hypothetical protein QY302_13935 [Anaerolineales bacterium]